MSSEIKRLAKKYLPKSAVRLLKRRTTFPSPREANDGVADSNHRYSDAHSIDRLERALWLGYEAASISMLSELAESAIEVSLRADASRTLGRWAMTRGDFETSLEYVNKAAASRPEIDPQTTALAVDCLSRLGKGREALALLSPLLHRRDVDSSTSIRAGVARALTEDDPKHGSGWLIAALNRFYLSNGLVLLNRRDVSVPHGVNNLAAGPAPRIEPAEATVLVSVIIPTHNSATTIETAISSVVKQSWVNLEIIVVDDSSDDSTTDVVRSLMESDPRITLLLAPVHSGPFISRNFGLEASKGEFVVVHQVDEWAHPQKVEAQATLLLSSPSLAAVGTYGLRIGVDFMHRPFGGLPDHLLVRQHISSLLLRRTVFDDVGWWDGVRVAGDSEFLERIQASFGREAVEWIKPGIPMALVCSLDQDLNDQSDVHSTLNALGPISQYREAYRWWHGSPQFRSALPYRPSSSPRPFPAPPSIARLDDRREEQTLMLLLVGDFRRGAGSVEMLKAAIDRVPIGLGLVHIPLFEAETADISPEVLSLAAAGRIGIFGSDTAIRCRRIVILPSMLDSPPFDYLPEVRTDEAMVIRSDTLSSDAIPRLSTEDLERWVGVNPQIVVAQDADLIEAISG